MGRHTSEAQTRTLVSPSSSNSTYIASVASTGNWLVLIVSGEAVAATHSTLACPYAGCFIGYTGGSCLPLTGLVLIRNYNFDKY